MSSFDFSLYPDADHDTMLRTAEFLTDIQYKLISDAELSKRIYQGICIDARDERGNTALKWAAQNGYIKTLQALLTAGANIEAQSEDNYTPLIWAADNGHTEAVKVLLAAGANIEARESNNCYTALTRAAWSGHSETVQALLEAGANIGVTSGFYRDAWNLTRDDKVRELVDPSKWRMSYDNFIENGAAPKSAAEVYRLLAETPLEDTRAPVDYAGNIRKIFAHAHWADKEQVTEVLTQMHQDGRINAETFDSIIASIFPERLHTMQIQPRSSGMAL